jgi:hypothetical protein
MAVMSMRSFTYLHAGETVSCVGCHAPRDAAPASVHPPGNVRVHELKPPAGPQYAGGLSFARTVQPVLDRYCITCHGLDDTEGDINLLGTIADSDPESFQRVVDWLDLNAQFYGDYSWNKDEWRRPSPKGERALREGIRKTFGPKMAEQPYAALVNVGLVTESRILKAPLAKIAGGWGQVAGISWRDVDDPGYKKMRQLVEQSIAPLVTHDIEGTCGREPCVCRSCWVRVAQESIATSRNSTADNTANGDAH